MKPENTEQAINWEAEAETATQDPSEDQLTHLATLVTQQIRLEDQLADLEASKKKLSEELNKLIQTTIPDFLQDTGLSEIKLSSGVKVKIEEKLRVSTTGKNRERINRWLEETGHADLIKDDITISFGAGHDEEASQVFRDIASGHQYADISRTRSCHSQTFAALMRELLASGHTDIPLEELGVFVQKFSKLERP